jgi:hypothetical protein
MHERDARRMYLRTFRRHYDPALLEPSPLVDLVLSMAGGGASGAATAATE